MDKRQTEQENETWSNPCDFNKSHINSQLKYKSQLAEDVAIQSRDTINRMMGYKDDIAELHSYSKFEDMLDIWSGTLWLRSYNDSWLEKPAFPDNKTLGKPMEEEELKKLVEDPTKVDNLLPVISKALKMVGAALQAVSEPDKKWMPDDLRNNLTMASKDVRLVLCYVSEVTRARNQRMLPLYNKEIPKYTEEREAVRDAFLIYRDTINLLEYVEELFRMMSKTDIYEKN
ncbi:uncharacterized protein LOC126371498 isoform X2 [Pectinophora gossypiella]|uniref:Uncharacterized protein n=2 Tax=Pectinophora gossypiella TaxID=13191 RepID=A0A1E1VZ12_PECGO|nr:uncharacterized protein LOC126371498 isoform X2 [Pectinophora gossypiella]XP_049872769.1 uncharacterized protein LOC126371498 isoform X2 [Pectinophora gossypiella]